MSMTVKDLIHSNFFLLAGPCVVESHSLCEKVAGTLKEITAELDIPYVFKASYRKANRSRSDSFSGIGDEQALGILGRIREKFNVPVVTDIHSADEAALAAQYVDILQIPAFLCRQSDILAAAGETGKIVNIKKGQFLSAGSMKFAAEKVLHTGNKNIILTERGNMFGYSDLVVDFRNIPEMRSIGYPVILDITHSLQQPNQAEGITGGRPDMIATLARAGIASGVDGIFMETHPDPEKALSDGVNMLKLNKVEGILRDLVALRKTLNSLQKVT